MQLLEKYSSDPAIEVNLMPDLHHEYDIFCRSFIDFSSLQQVAETCQLALERIQWVNSAEKNSEKLSDNPFMSVDPAPPCADLSTEDLRTILLDENSSLFRRYRAMFALRNRRDSASVAALAEGNFAPFS